MSGFEKQEFDIEPLEQLEPLDAEAVERTIALFARPDSGPLMVLITERRDE